MDDVFPKPGPEHARLKRLTGAWTAKITYFPANGGPPEVQNGEFLARMDLGGYFLCREINFGMTGFQGRGMMGWHAFRGSYAGTWADSTAPIIYPTIGHFDERGAFCEMTEGPDATGEIVRMRMTTEIQDNEMFFQMYEVGRTAPDRLVVEIMHTRRRFI